MRASSPYSGSKVLVTGGLGFIGSNLALRLAAAGAQVTVVDSVVPGCGANPYNLSGAGLRLIEADIGDAALFGAELRSASHIFNLAGEISHIHSMRRPERDAELNARAQLRFLEECMRQAPRVRVVYASTRQIYGAPRYLPVDEAHPVSPIDFNGVHKYVASAYHEMFTGVGRLDAISLRLTNVYGPRMALRIPCQGFLGTFLRRAMRQQPIEIFGDGRQMRDPVYVDDAVDAFLLAGAARHPVSRVYNVGGPETHSLARIATIVSDAAGAPAPVFRPFPADLRPIDIGSYSSDTRSICNELGWQPRVFLRQGICQSVAYFRRHLDQYLGPEDSEASCPLEAAWESQAH